MTPERYRRIAAIFSGAADLEGDARAAYLDRECGQDSELRRQVLSVLEADGDDPVVSRPPGEGPREDFSGRLLGRYRIAEKVGEGGMSTVYRAEDTKLDRTVALKFLTPEMLRSEQAFARFVREAKASAALDHPNICTTYDFEQIEGHSFIAMALLEGETLANKLQRGPLPVVEAVDIARQAARGLHAAHRKGVIHRDVKPGNLMLVEAGVVKVMDFGVARLEHGETLTYSGTTIGTISYMSPEQIEGHDVDGRSDIWALGAVLYEMLAGRSPFDRPAAREAVAAIRGAEPRPIQELRPDVPDAVAEAIARCLRKSPAERYQDAGELRSRLDEIHDLLRTRELTAEHPALSRPPAGLARRVLPWVGMAAALLLIVAWTLRSPTGEEGANGDQLTVEQFTSLPGFETEPAISPDGTRIAYAWDRGEAERTDIYVQLLGSYEPMRLTQTPDSERNPVWSPDGTRIAFLRYRANSPRDAQADVVIVPVLGGPELRLAQIRTNSLRSNLDWSPTGDLLAISDNGAVFLLPADHSRSEDSPPLTHIGSGYSPKFDASGKRLAYTSVTAAGERQLHVTAVSGGEPAIYAESTPDFTWSADGVALILREGPSLLRRLQLNDGSAIDTRVPGVRALSSLTVRGKLLAATDTHNNVNIWSVDLSSGGGTARVALKLIASSGMQFSPQFSPAGDQIAFASDRLGDIGVWLCDRDGKNARALARFEGGAAGTPRWSPDGRTVVFDGNPADEVTQIWSVSADGGAPRQLTDAYRNIMPFWSHDGEWIYYCSIRDGGRHLFKVRSDGSESVAVHDRMGWETQESQDGRFLYYSMPRGQVTLFRLDLESGESAGIPEVGNAGATRHWALADAGIYFVDKRTEPGWIQFLDFSSMRTRKAAPIGAIHEGPGGLALSPDGDTLLYAQRDRFDSDIVLLKGFE